MAALIIFFPVAAGLLGRAARAPSPGSLDLARTMGAAALAILRPIRLPAALPAFASGLRIAAAVAPIGAVIGEWVGASAGLGYLMLHANARMQTDLMFAALLVLAAIRWRSASPSTGRFARWSLAARGACPTDDGEPPCAARLAVARSPSCSPRRRRRGRRQAHRPARLVRQPRPRAAGRRAGERLFSRAAGLDVELVAPADPNDPPKLVAAGQADVAISYQPQLHLQVAEGLPLARIGTLVGHAAQRAGRARGRAGQVASRTSRAARSASRSAGSRTRCSARMLAAAGLKLADVKLVNVNFSLSPALLAGPGRRGDRRLPQLRAEPACPRRPARAAPSPRGARRARLRRADLRRPPRRLRRPALARFLAAVERGTLLLSTIPTRPGRFQGDRPGARRRAEPPRLARPCRASPTRPAALDRGRYARFAAFLKEQGLIKSRAAPR